MKGPASLPPRGPRALLRLLLPAAEAHEVARDLDEEFIRFVLPKRGPVRAHLWYWRQALLSLPALLSARSRGSEGALGADLRFALRRMRRRPGFATAAILTLALGLGASTTTFAVLRAVVLQPLPYAHADRLVRPMPEQLFFVDSREAQEFSLRTTTLDAVSAWARTLLLFTEGGDAEEVVGARVWWNHFDMLGAPPLLGRTFAREDAASGNTIVLSHALWVRRFGADPGIVGTSATISGRTVTVLGVMGPNHVPMEHTWQAWTTLPLDPEQALGSGMVVNGRLRAGVSLQQAEEEMRVVLGDIWVEGGDEVTPEDRAAMTMVPLSRWLLGDASQGITLLAAAVGFLTLLACVNVTTLLLAQSGARARELAVRTALGGTRARLSRQLLTEVMVLCVIGGALGLLASAASLKTLVALMPGDLPRLSQIGISGGVLAFAFATSLIAAALTAALPVARSRVGLTDVLGGRGASAGRARSRVRSVLVGAEMAIAVVLVVGAGLMARSLVSLQAVDPGFQAQGVVTLRPTPQAARHPSGAPLASFYERLGGELERIPGVRTVGAIQFLPMTSGGWWSTFRRVQDGPTGPEHFHAMRVIDGEYFETMQIRMLRGRGFDEGELRAEGLPVVVVNERLAREAFSGEEPLGQVLVWESLPEGATVIGVVGDVRQNDLRTDTHAEAYIPFARVPWRRMHMVMRVEGDVDAVLTSAREAMRTVDDQAPAIGPRLMTDVVGATLGRSRLLAVVMALFGVLALGLGGVGVYGVTAQAVAERNREIGIRMALGAGRAGVAGRTVAEGLVPVALGLGAGLVATILAARVVEGLVFGVAARDPGTLLGAPLVLLAVATASLVLPAVRASRVDPAMTLQEE